MIATNFGKEKSILDALKDASVFKKTCIYLLIIFAVSTSFFDDMGVMKHIWLASFASYLVFQFYNHVVLPKLDAELLSYNSNLKASVFAISVSYILSSMSGAGLMTAFLNLICISATISIILPMLPKYYFPSAFAIASLVFVALAITQVLNYLISIPAAIIFSTFSYYSFKSQDECGLADGDIEDVSFLSGHALNKSPKSRKMEIFKTAGALFISLVTGIVILYWIMLSINPFWMRAARISKYETLHRLPHDSNLRVREVSSLADLKFYKKNIKSFPVVIKPSICTTNSRNILKCDNYQCLEKYLSKRISEGPLGDGQNGDQGSWVIQEFSSKIEGVVFYYKLPYMNSGAIKNIGIRDESVKGTFEKDISGNTLTAKYWPDKFRTDFSPEYVKYFDDLASKIPGYTGGRFDVMLPSDKLQDPRGVAILELNVFFLGCIDEKSPKSFLNDLKRLRTSIVQLYIGIVNIVAGYNFSNFWGILIKLPGLFSRAFMCGNYEHIMAKP
jgi:hypothetical protein